MIPALILLLATADTGASSESAEQTALAAARALVARDYAAATAHFDPVMKARLPVDKLRSTWEPLAVSAGKLIRVGEARRAPAPAPAAELVVVPIVFERGTWNLKVFLAADGEITGLFIAPRSEWRPPDCGRARVAEAAVKVGPLALPGTLTLPWGKGPFPAVVLVHGSGPHDADETLGPNKPFADLALGLAARGIASLRYEKRTLAHPEEFASGRLYGVEEETVADAVAAVRLASTAPGVDAARIWIVGHSLGAYLAPRIAARAPEAAGIVLLAGPARPLEDLVVEQMGTLAGPGSPAVARAPRVRRRRARPEARSLYEGRHAGRDPPGFLLPGPAPLRSDRRGRGAAPARARPPGRARLPGPAR